MNATGQYRSSPELARVMGAVARELLGAENEDLSTKEELRFGSRGSVVVDVKAGTFFDHEAGKGGGVIDLVRERKALDKDGAVAWMHERGHLPPPSGPNIVARYPYTDADGQLLYEVVRLATKDFRQRRPDPSGRDRWNWSMKGVQRVPYRLPELRTALAEGEPVFFTEGEKAADAIVKLELAATCSPGGANKWRRDYAPWFNGADVVILPDNDEPGRNHAATVALGLAGHARSVRTLALPNLPDKGDVFDWIAAGGTAERLIELADTASLRADPESAAEPSPDLAQHLSAEAWAVRDFPPSVRLLGDLVTTTSRTFLVGATGLGKTMMGVAIAASMATGTGFLDWRCDRPVRVLYLDGEMPGELVRARLCDAMRRLGRNDLAGNLFVYCADTAEQTTKLVPGLGSLEPLNTEAGQNFLYALIDKLGGIDVLILDNVMSLIAGDQKDEVPWSEALPLIAGLTRRQIGQIWLDHAGHNTARQYGSSTKAWRFDAVGIMTELPEDQRTERETAFKLSFDAPGKARRRTPDNWTEFAPRIIRLRDDRWSSESEGGSSRSVGKVPPSRAIFHTALIAATTTSCAGPGKATLAEWETECIRRGLIEAPAASEDYKARDARTRPWRTAKHALIAAGWVAIDGPQVRDLLNRYS